MEIGHAVTFGSVVLDEAVALVVAQAIVASIQLRLAITARETCEVYPSVA